MEIATKSRRYTILNLREIIVMINILSLSQGQDALMSDSSESLVGIFAPIGIILLVVLSSLALFMYYVCRRRKQKGKPGCCCCYGNASAPIKQLVEVPPVPDSLIFHDNNSDTNTSSSSSGCNQVDDLITIETSPTGYHSNGIIVAGGTDNPAFSVQSSLLKHDTAIMNNKNQRQQNIISRTCHKNDAILGEYLGNNISSNQTRVQVELHTSETCHKCLSADSSKS